eukprot:CAMPEP_0194232036 /NCGR_PEP_ID=MMETSP0158-20130606/561_1 /TAXON_ID=33649 /ORGANISM="Thalassionema nitzschioides, Strain L26-B" /LENGTH=141 /DNA_ID=CAMNT_0038964749 /DNA_START=26 /DNA_END=451 /DNA_ORIENTATION=+
MSEVLNNNEEVKSCKGKALTQQPKIKTTLITIAGLLTLAVVLFVSSSNGFSPTPNVRGLRYLQEVPIPARQLQEGTTFPPVTSPPVTSPPGGGDFRDNVERNWKKLEDWVQVVIGVGMFVFTGFVLYLFSRCIIGRGCGYL